MSSGPPTDDGPLERRGWAARSLRVQLIAEMLGLLAVVCLALTAVIVAAFHHLEITQLDQELSRTAGRVVHFDIAHPPGSPPTSTPLRDAPGVSAQTVLVRIANGRVVDAGLHNTATGAWQDLSTGQTAAVRQLPLGHPVTGHIPGLGNYRLLAVEAPNGVTVIAGLPLAPLYAAQHRLIAVGAGLSLVALIVAAALGGLIIRRTLRPLERVAATARHVTELPLHRGEVALSVRVSDVDARTEVGQVGAALNQMIGHVADALAARQAGETRLRQFSADASHELRTPLAVIRGYAELIRRRADLQPEVADAIGHIEAETLHMTTLVEDLLALARLDSDQPLTHEPVDLSWLVIDVVSDARVAGPEHVWRLDLPDEPVIVTGNEGNLHRAVANLLTNARVHTPSGTTVTSSLRGSDDGAVLRVVDDGPGISADLLPRVFERFTRGEASRRYSAGTGGLGLAIVKAIVEAHGGSVEVSSRPGQTAFTVRLPKMPGVPPGPDVETPGTEGTLPC